MRSAAVGIACSVLVLGALGVGGALLVRDEAEPIKPPVLTWEQTSAAVKVHIHNANEKWGLRDQRIKILLRTKEGLPIRLYGPDGVYTIDGKPGREISCCRISLLPPSGDYTFTLFPIRKADVRVGGLSVDVIGGPGWLKM